MSNVYSGVGLAALFNPVIDEHRRLRNKASEIKAAVKSLAREGSKPTRPARPESGPQAAGLA